MSTKSDPLVSVCIAAYNSASYIRETLDCVFAQTYKNIEVIVVDDGSEDETERLLKEVSFPHFRYIKQANKGASVARNAAHQLSTGELIKFMDSDDLINKECIESQVLSIKDSPDRIASAKWGRFYLTDISSLQVKPESVWKNMTGIDWLVESLIDHGTNMMQCGIFLIPRKLIEKAGLWDENLTLIDDFEYMVRIISNCAQVIFCDEALLMYRSGISNNLSGQKTRRHMESAFKAISLGASHILKKKDNKTSRLACANVYQEWAHRFYPDHYDLYEKSLTKIMELGGSDLKIGGSKMYMFLAQLMGWERAKLFKKVLLGRY